MMRSSMHKRALFTALLAMSFACDASQWQIDTNESEISFTATQNDAPVTGKFTGFKGDIDFDPKQLATSKVFVSIDTNSVTTSYKQVADTLKTDDWLNVKIFPEATFKSNNITQKGNNQYEANGTLTIRNISLPMTINFELNNPSQNKSQVKGKTTIKRNSFGVGQGEWSSTEEVKDIVSVDFNLILKAQNK
ncbi:MAG: YceI family protein [Candidatus Berkiellales bacterium]